MRGHAGRGFQISAALLLLFAVLAASGCGRRTPPRPLSRVLPPVERVTLHQQDSRVVAAWNAPRQHDRYGTPVAYRLLIERSVLGCVRCDPVETWELDVKPDSAGGPGRIFHAFDISPEPALWRVRVLARFEAGDSLPSKSVLLEAPARVPRHELGGGWSGKETAVLRLEWSRRRERTVHKVDTMGRSTSRELYFRVNLYRRRAGETWPLKPLNPKPIAESQWEVPGAFRQPAKGAPQVEYALRLVDQSGNEGPLSRPLVPSRRSASS